MLFWNLNNNHSKRKKKKEFISRAQGVQTETEIETKNLKY